jgi:hypothetical protein
MKLQSTPKIPEHRIMMPHAIKRRHRALYSDATSESAMIIKNISVELWLIALLLTGCADTRPDKDNKSRVNDNIGAQVIHLPKSGEDSLKASYFADTIIYVPLETNEESLIRMIEKIWVNDSLILIYCEQAGILLFRHNGQFIRKIGKRGKGPGEYEKVFHFDVIRDTIYVSPVGKRALIRYTFDGVFCDEIKFNYEPVLFTSTVDEKLAVYRKAEGKVLVYNKNLYKPDTITVEYGVTVGRYYYQLSDPTFMRYLQKNQKALLFNDYMSDTIWNITCNKKEPAFILDVKDKLPRDKHIEFCQGDLKGWENMSKNYQLAHLIPFPSCVFIFQKNYYDPEPDAIYLNYTRTGAIRKYNTRFIYDDIISKHNLPFPYYFIYNKNYLVTEIEPFRIIREIEQKKTTIEDSTFWLDQLKVQQGDNPVIVLIKIKSEL